MKAKLVGCVKRAHEFDKNLTSHIMIENLAVKASGVLAGLHLIDKLGVNQDEIEYIIECSEEAFGDMNQRGGGNIAKAIGEMLDLNWCYRFRYERFLCSTNSCTS